ncbi:phosphate/phosphite/phosphonate ABC transporter substrate-binding protein [Vibrio sp. HN007]|uniref:phosphate/phosphite/phosphonate ABC transporter substrate-binding protein n=1 Tax=Vibrio iocasae TaxID=3098914 RepID=UPI0035D4524E
MFRNITSGLSLSLAVLLFSGLANGAGEQSSTQSFEQARNTIVVGRVSTNPKKHYKHQKLLVDYLAKNLSEFGITEGKILFAKNNEQMIRYIKQGKIDLITETVFSATEFKNRAGAEMVLRRWKKGVPEYSSLIFARKDSGIKSFDDLVGKTIAFQDAGSSTAFFIPAALLIQSGFQLVPLDNPRESTPPGTIGYVFANKEINISAWVHKGIVAAGALSDLDWDNEEDLPENFRADSVIIYESVPFPRSVELFRPDMDSALKQRITELLLTAHETEEGKNALRAYQKTTKFDELSAHEESLLLIDDLVKIVTEQL